MRQRSFFELWQNSAMDLATNNVHFYDEYTGAIRIYALGAFSGDAFRDRIAMVFICMNVILKLLLLCH